MKFYKRVSVIFLMLTVFFISMSLNALPDEVPTETTSAASTSTETTVSLLPTISPTLTPSPEPTQVPTPTPTSKLKLLGSYRLTAYCPCYKCSEGYGTNTSTGVKATQGRTIAVDPRVIPYGSIVVINGHEYVAEDCGGAIKGKRIDVYFNDHKTASDFGVQYAEVYIKT
jgi:3D (Asp-Asp-Asp) domain-containing protein